MSDRMFVASRPPGGAATSGEPRLAAPTTDVRAADARMQLVKRLLESKVGSPTLGNLTRVSPGTAVPLSPAQARIWFFSRLYPTSAEYNAFETLRLAVTPAESVLEEAVRTLMRRHDALRLRILERDGDALQEDTGDIEPSVTWHDLAGMAPAAAEEEARRIGSASARTALTLDRSPLFRVSAIRLPAGQALLVLVAHHIVVDFWSEALLLEELSALLAGEPLRPAGTMRFIDYVSWQRGTVDELRLGREMSYWATKLGGALPVLDLPKDRPRPVVLSRRGRAVPCAIPAEVVGRLHRLAEAEGTTLFVTLLAAYKALLLRLTGQRDLIVGVPLAGREHPATEGVVGCFVKTVALRTDLGGTPSFRDVVWRVHATLLEAQDHQSVPYERIVAELKIPRELNYHPVFQTLFGLQSSVALRCPGAEAGTVLLECETAKWDITVSLTETARGLTGFVEYSSDLFDESTVTRYVAMYKTLLQAVAADADVSVRAPRLVSPAERDRILHGLNPYLRPHHPYRTLAEPFEAQVERTPEAIALVGEEGSLSYANLNARANRLAWFLRAAGARRGAFVALCMERSFAMVVALYAVAKSGAAYVPIEPELPDARIAFMLEDAGPVLVLVDRVSGTRIPPGPWQVISPEDDGDTWSGLPAENLSCEGPTHHLAHLLYTSGSTGRPKAVAYPVDGAIADILWLQNAYPFRPGDSALLKTSYGFDVSIWEIFWPLYCGARLVVPDPDAHRDPRCLRELIERYHVTTMFLIPAMMQAFLDELPPGSCRSLRWAFCGGEPVTPRIRDAFYARLESRLINCYGPTEAGCVTDMVVAPAEGAPTVPLGRPAANFRLYVLDDDLQLMPIGVPGEAHIGGEVGLAQCYFNRPDLTAERFLPDPFGAPGARMYRTGDLCRYLDDGVLEHLGRSGRQVKVRGMRVELAEIETVLSEHEAVAACIVLTDLEEGQQRILAFVVPRRHEPQLPRQLVAHAGRLLPRYMVPTSITTIDRVPVTLNGKVDREALLRCWREAGTYEPREVVPPSGEREEALKRIFEAVLGLTEFSVTDSFFDLGGHSLLIFKLVAACAQELHVRPSVADVFAAPSVRELSARLSASEGQADVCLVPLLPKPGYPIVVFVHAASGSALPFFEVARHLGPDFSTFALQAPEADEGSGVVHSIEHLAAGYVDAVDAVRGLSPLILAGWSMGGCVALEMARCWRQRGVDVAAILMLDTWIPPGLLDSAPARAQARAAILEMDVLGMEGFNAPELDDAPDAIRRMARVLDRNRQAFLEYEPAWFDGEVDLLRAVESFPDSEARFPDVYASADHGWKIHVRSVAVQDVAGNHFTLVAKDNAAILADTICAIVAARLSFSDI